MPELVEQMYCSQQIVIPPKFPYILKRYCKAAIKTQPYDLLRWSYEYFKALAAHRPPPVKLRLEYPVYSTEGGLTRGCLKVLAIQLSKVDEVHISVLKSAWGGFCLDPYELMRILCLCEVHLRADTVPFLHFIAAAAGLLTKSLTHTMILLCETLTKEPDGGSAAIPIKDFLAMYKFLAKIDASKDVRYINGYREGEEPTPEPSEEEEQSEVVSEEASTITDDYWKGDPRELKLQKVDLINAHVARTPKLSNRMNQPALGKIQRTPSMEKLGQIERENYAMERSGRARRSHDVDQILKDMSKAKLSQLAVEDETPKKEEVKAPEKKEGIEIFVYNEDEAEIPYEFYGEPVESEYVEEEETASMKLGQEKEPEPIDAEKQELEMLIAELYSAREERIADMEFTFDEIAALVNRYKSANYDLGMVAGRQMSTTSGEFIVNHIEREIMAYVDEQIAILPDPDLKKKKAKPEEILMVRDILDQFLKENMEVIIPDIEEVEEEEIPIPEVTVVYAVPGIGPVVDDEIQHQFEDYARDACKVQGELFMPRNVRHFLCPPLEKFVEYDYESQSIMKKEEVPTSGAITD